MGNELKQETIRNALDARLSALSASANTSAGPPVLKEVCLLMGSFTSTFLNIFFSSSIYILHLIKD